jgi:hypothetical protein
LTSRKAKYRDVTVSNGMRWLAAFTGCFTAVVGLYATYGLSLVLSPVLVVGAAAAGYLPRTGRSLMWLGAAIVSLVAFPLGVLLLWQSRIAGQDPLVTGGAMICVGLVLWCDVALVADFVKIKRARRADVGLYPTRVSNRNAVVSAVLTCCVLMLIGCGFIGYKLFVDRLATRSYQEDVALDGKGPQGLLDHWEGPDAVVLYRSGRNGVVCYDAFHSKELHDFLLSKNGRSVTVQYDTFSDFGKVRGYNVRSVDGMMLANGTHVFKPEFGSSSGVFRNGPGTAGGDNCW